MRTEKKTRKKGLPPRILIQQRDSESGSLPTISRAASDNRTGVYPISFNDNNTIIFTSSVENIIHGVGIVSGSYLMISGGFTDYGTDLLTGKKIITTGSLRKGVVDEFISMPSVGQPLKPFNDHSNPAADAISNQSEFFATGSSISVGGENFTNPLWSKTKLEIDLSVNSAHTVGISNFNTATPWSSWSLPTNEQYDSNYPMMYWNPDSKTWQGIGSGKAFRRYTESFTNNNTSWGTRLSSSDHSPISTLQKMVSEQCIGFKWSMFDPKSGNAIYHDLGDVTNTFGFPFSQKYTATSSNLVPMSNFINRPFLLEKVYLQFTGALEQLNYFGITQPAETAPRAWSSGSITNFFILNQRGPVSYRHRQLTTFFRSGSEHYYVGGYTDNPKPIDGYITNDYLVPNKVPITTPCVRDGLLASFDFQRNFFEKTNLDSGSLIPCQELPADLLSTAYGTQHGRFILHEPYENRVAWRADPRTSQTTNRISNGRIWLSASVDLRPTFQRTDNMAVEFLWKWEPEMGYFDQFEPIVPILECATPDHFGVYWKIIANPVVEYDATEYAGGNYAPPPFFRLSFDQDGLSNPVYFPFSGSFGKWNHIVVYRHNYAGTRKAGLYVNGNFIAETPSLGGASTASTTVANLNVNGGGLIAKENSMFGQINFYSQLFGGAGQSATSDSVVRQLFSSSLLYPSYSISTDSSIRDLVANLQIASINLSGSISGGQIGWSGSNNSALEISHTDLYKKCNTIAPGEHLAWSGKIFSSGAAHSLKAFTNVPSVRETGTGYSPYVDEYSSFNRQFPTTRPHWIIRSASTDTIALGDNITMPGRNGVQFSTGRSLLAESDYFDGSMTLKIDAGTSVGNRSVLTGSKAGLHWNANAIIPVSGNLEKKTNPYLLFPQDNLILGFQVPLNQLFISGSSSIYAYESDGGPKLTFSPGEAKLILYGSYITEGHEEHDTLNQLLTSNNIHEVIG